MTFAKLCLGVGAALLLAGCDAAAGVQFNMQMAEMEREHEATRAKLDALFPADLPTAPAGNYRSTVMKDGAAASESERCFSERTIRQLMSVEIDAPTSWCPIDGQCVDAAAGGWRFHAACDFSELGRGKQDVTVSVTGGLRTSFTVKTVKVYAQPKDGKTSESSTVKWDYRGACRN